MTVTYNYVKSPDGSDTIIKYVAITQPNGQVQRQAMVITREQANRQLIDAQNQLTALGPVPEVTPTPTPGTPLTQ